MQSPSRWTLCHPTHVGTMIRGCSSIARGPRGSLAWLPGRDKMSRLFYRDEARGLSVNRGE
jgi:hypothetical protein